MTKNDAYGVYFIFKSMEQGSSFRVAVPKYTVADPNYRILAHQRSRFTHYYFYIRDEVLGTLVMRVASFFPFQTTYYLNGPSFIEQNNAPPFWLLPVRVIAGRRTGRHFGITTFGNGVVIVTALAPTSSAHHPSRLRKSQDMVDRHPITGSANGIYKPTSTNSRFGSTGASTRSTRLPFVARHR